MISYKLAKTLKNAGFPQGLKHGDWAFVSEELHLAHSDNDTGWFMGEDYTTYFPSPDNDKYSERPPFSEYVKCPTLSELIEACLDFYYPSHFSMGGMNTWWAILRDEHNSKALVPVQSGSTPEEAMANLWLELQK